MVSEEVSSSSSMPHAISFFLFVCFGLCSIACTMGRIEQFVALVVEHIVWNSWLTVYASCMSYGGTDWPSVCSSTIYLSIAVGPIILLTSSW